MFVTFWWSNLREDQKVGVSYLYLMLQSTSTVDENYQKCIIMTIKSNFVFNFQFDVKVLQKASFCHKWDISEDF